MISNLPAINCLTYAHISVIKALSLILKSDYKQLMRFHYLVWLRKNKGAEKNEGIFTLQEDIA